MGDFGILETSPAGGRGCPEQPPAADAVIRRIQGERLDDACPPRQQGCPDAPRSAHDAKQPHC
jgi:hypothetical protein